MVDRCLAARRRLLQQASLIVVPNAERAERLARLAGGRGVLTVWNCPRRPTATPNMSRAGDRLRVIFRGSVNEKRLPLTVIDALARVLAPISLDVAGYETAGSRGFFATLGAHATDLGIGDRVRILGTVPEPELAAICQRCDVGLALMPMISDDENMQHMTGASNKVFEYLSYGIAPLVSDLPDWRQTFVDGGYALACDPTDVDSIAATFGWAAAHSDAVRAVATRGWERLGKDWNYESQFAPVVNAMWGRAAVTPTRTRVAVHEGVECAS
jgi:glycosyltransferase involved in cell wall biosynthesis